LVWKPCASPSCHFHNLTSVLFYQPRQKVKPSLGRICPIFVEDDLWESGDQLLILCLTLHSITKLLHNMMGSFPSCAEPSLSVHRAAVHDERPLAEFQEHCVATIAFGVERQQPLCQHLHRTFERPVRHDIPDLAKPHELQTLGLQLHHFLAQVAWKVVLDAGDL
jgi:hypothetical protein